ncbi:uncharacterized protein DSM5745_05539 [Aspergillus mulundensis]|uniref:DUF6536 domain-containing protein n=1 Tax=Aspergillus mulundensis TaxID=1810919 RepID=A0A3D8RX97_9EURO|nr:hypothetical protein DSM5745_05539 [Aspergillus mulundensis]RDW78687.1 hypothetical protein DSM5745_05539 [Aspergillus mulundensis]
MKFRHSSFWSRFRYKLLSNPENAKETTATGASPQRKKHWIQGVYLCAYISSAVLLVNLIFLAVAEKLAADIRDQGSSDKILSSWAFQVIHDGSCALSERWSLALHLMINVLGTAVLAASNYTMQTLVAPCREEVDAHHKKGKWLDIGTSSIKNLLVVGRYRAVIWAVLLVTATPFHLLYNSAIYAVIAKSRYSTVLAASDLNPSDISNYATPELESCFRSTAPSANWSDFASGILHRAYRRVDENSCNKFRRQIYQSGVQTVVVLSDELSVHDPSDRWILYSDDIWNDGTHRYEGQGYPLINQEFVFSIPTVDNRTVTYTPGNFTVRLCESKNINDHVARCTEAESLAVWLNETWPWSLSEVNEYVAAQELNFPIQVYSVGSICREGHPYYSNSRPFSISAGCLLLNAPERCRLAFSRPILLTIIGVTTLKVLAMFLAARLDRSRSAPLLTIGDAIASFLSRPDDTTNGRCWAGRPEVRKTIWPAKSASPPRRLPQQGRWVRAATMKRWIVTLSVSGTLIGVGIWLLSLAAKELAAMRGQEVNTLLFKTGFGQYTEHEYNLLEGIFTAQGLVLLANAPQFAVTVSYYFYNNILTNMLAASEYDSYGITKKGLRVSWPEINTSQRSTYWLSTPYRYSVPVLVLYTSLHWTLSQSLFYVQIVRYKWDQTAYWPGDFPDGQLALSPLAILVSILLGTLMVSLLLGLAFRRFRSMAPLAGSCSLAISAACHPGADEDAATAASREVKWGETAVLPEGMDAVDGVGHCSFTSKEVSVPLKERRYA